MIKLPEGWEERHPGLVIDTIRSGQKASHDRGWDDCNLWVQYDYAVKNFKCESYRVNEFEAMREKMEQVRKMETDTRKSSLTHCLVAHVMQELDP